MAKLTKALQQNGFPQRQISRAANSTPHIIEDKGKHSTLQCPLKNVVNIFSFVNISHSVSLPPQEFENAQLPFTLTKTSSHLNLTNSLCSFYFSPYRHLKSLQPTSPSMFRIRNTLHKKHFPFPSSFLDVAK